jgi:hypothetical protein
MRQAGGRLLRALTLTLAAIGVLVLGGAPPALADDEASNVERTVASPDGHCTARSVPAHAYDPPGGARQEGLTEVTRNIAGRQTVVARHDWYAERLHVLCWPGAGDDVLVVRIGPWARGRRPLPSHLALAFYRNGRPLKEYSTWDIAGGQEADPQAVHASVSHYQVFAEGPDLMATDAARAEDGARLAPPGSGNDWVMRTRTFDGRVLWFEVETGRLR